jgi:DNA-binding MarR family transcriptional regulator
MDARRRAVADHLHSAAIHVLRVARAVDVESGLSPARLSLLSVLVFGGPRTIGGLAAAEGVRSPTMTQLVNGLEADGLVVRRGATGDARRVVVEATPAGRRQMRRAQGRRLDVLQAVLEPLGDRELTLLDEAARVLERAVRHRVGAATGAGAPHDPDSATDGP